MRFLWICSTSRTPALWHLFCTRLAVLVAVLVSSGQPLQAQTFTSGSNGSDGALTITTAGGGNGSGGAIRLAAPVVNGTGTLSVQRGFAGSDGLVRIEDFPRAFLGNVSPFTSRVIASPSAVLLPPPAPVPSVRVVSVAGVPVPPNPTGSITMPDVTIDTPAAVPLAIEARNIPPGTIVELHILHLPSWLLAGLCARDLDPMMRAGESIAGHKSG
jgi:hypothetical protein